MAKVQEEILFVDDDPNILEIVKRTFNVMRTYLFSRREMPAQQCE